MRASFLARALSATITLLVTPFAFATVRAEFLPLLASVTAGLLFEAMSHASYLSPAGYAVLEDLLMPEPIHLWLYKEFQEVENIIWNYERRNISATWANLSIEQVVCNARNPVAGEFLLPTWDVGHALQNRGACVEKRKREDVPGTYRSRKRARMRPTGFANPASASSPLPGARGHVKKKRERRANF